MSRTNLLFFLFLFFWYFTDSSSFASNDNNPRSVDSLCASLLSPFNPDRSILFDKLKMTGQFAAKVRRDLVAQVESGEGSTTFEFAYRGMFISLSELKHIMAYGFEIARARNYEDIGQAQIHFAPRMSGAVPFALYDRDTRRWKGLIRRKKLGVIFRLRPEVRRLATKPDRTNLIILETIPADFIDRIWVFDPTSLSFLELPIKGQIGVILSAEKHTRIRGLKPKPSPVG